MRILSPIFSLVLWLFAFAVGAALVGMAVYPPLITDYVSQFLYKASVEQPMRILVGAVGLGLMLMVVLRVVFVMSRGERRERVISFASSRGEINVSLDTIEDFLARRGAALPDVERLTVHLTPLDNERYVKVDVVARVYEGHDVVQLGERIRAHFIDATKDVLGLQEIGDVNVSVREMIESDVRGGTDVR